MEKYSAYRDAGTGIQPFLNPVPPNPPSVLTKILQVMGYFQGILRFSMILVVGVLYFFIVEVVLLLLHPIRPLQRTLTWLFTAFFARLALLLVGLWWIPISPVSGKRGRGTLKRSPWNPGAGDIIISNWVSWIEILWLAFRFNPTFLLPIPAEIPKSNALTDRETPLETPLGRRAGTGSAAVSSSRVPLPRIPILGYQTVSLSQMLRLTGCVPPYNGISRDVQSLEVIRQKAGKPVVIFPECTTSNGRALLRFSEAFGRNTFPVTRYKVFVMCVRYDPPTTHTHTLTSSIPSTSFHPLPHMFKVASALSLRTSLSIRLLNPLESPSSNSFIASEILSSGVYQDELAEACSVLISRIGKIKVTAMGWEDKVSFMQVFREKARR